MPDSVTFTPDYVAIGVWLRTSPEIRLHLEDLGRKGVAYARSIAPVGTRTTKDTHPGQYRDSIRFVVVVGKSRMSLRIVSDDYTAWWQEYGSKKIPRRAVLRRTLDFLASGHASAPSSYGGSEEYDAANAGTQRTRATRRRSRAAKAG